MKERIAIVYNEPKHTAAEDHWLMKSQDSSPDERSLFRDESEYGVLEQMESIAEALRGSGYEVTIYSANDDVRGLCEFLEKDQPDLIFNCCESILGKASLEMNVAAVYEIYGIEYTGSPALTLGIALNKGLTKDILVANGISTPRHEVVESMTEYRGTSLAFPLIVKPMKEDASIGIDANAIVRDDEALRERIAFVLSEFQQPAIVEEYIEGRELNVAVIADETGAMHALPISEITFKNLPAGLPKIVTYEAKWVEDSPFYRSTIPECPAQLTERVEHEAVSLAMRSARAIGLRDYGRIDMRLRDHDDVLFVLEANPNPDISEDAGFMRAARASGRTFDGTINEIVRLALLRTQLSNDQAVA